MGADIYLAEGWPVTSPKPNYQRQKGDLSGDAKSTLLAGFVAIGISGMAATPAYSEQIRIDATGIMSCGTWLQERTPGSALAAIHGSWIVGFVNGARWTDDKNWGGEVDAASLAAWVDNYCRNNPLNSVIHGASALMEELKLRTRDFGTQ